jgi:hypothetical protein
MAKYTKQQIYANEIYKLKEKLAEYDYVGTKLAEAIAKSIVDGNNDAVVSAYNEYKDILNQKQAWRDEINRLEAELIDLKVKVNNN